MPMSINQHTAQAIAHQPGAGDTVSMMGVTITYKVVGAQSDGQWLVMEYTAPPQMPGPPPHEHKITTEIFYVVEGVLAVQAGGQTTQLGAGGVAFVPPGTPHSFSNSGDAPAKFLLIASPAGLEMYFSEMGDLLKNETSWPPQDMSQVIALMAKHDTYAATAV